MSRLRVIAGPNGSGKSSVFELIKKFKENQKVIPTGPFVNSDFIEKTFRETGFVQLKDYGILDASPKIIEEYLRISTLKSPYSPDVIKDLIFLEDNCFKLKGKTSPRLGMIISDLIREELLKRKISFTMETVFSHEDKVNFMQRAKDAEYKVYLYFVSTENPEINIKRVEGRVAGGGHDVPKDKIVDRYYRTMSNLYSTNLSVVESISPAGGGKGVEKNNPNLGQSFSASWRRRIPQQDGVPIRRSFVRIHFCQRK